jgi:SAM-dependent methyltransferase
MEPRLGDESQEAVEVLFGPRLNEFLETIFEERERATNTERPDVITAAYCTALENTIIEDEQVRQTVEDFLNFREVSSSYAFQILRRALTKPLMRNMSDDSFPYTHFWAHAWESSIKKAVDPNSPIHDDLVFDLLVRNVQSNIGERYKGPVGVAHLMRYRLGECIDELDVGCSQNQGPKRTALMEVFAFGDVEVLYPESDEVDEEATLAMNALIKRKLRLNHAVGIDVIDAKDYGNKEWARACTFYLLELLDITKVEKYDAIDMLQPPNVHFYQGDFTDFDLDDFAAQSPTDKFSMVVFSTMMYQAESDQQRQVMLENAKKLLKPSGIIVIQDFVSIDPNDSTKLIFHDDLAARPFIYKTLILDPADPKGEFYEVFVWKNGRCETLRFGKDFARICLEGTVDLD